VVVTPGFSDVPVATTRGKEREMQKIERFLAVARRARWAAGMAWMAAGLMAREQERRYPGVAAMADGLLFAAGLMLAATAAWVIWG